MTTMSQLSRGYMPALLLAFGWLPSGRAQQWVNPNYDAHHLDFRDLGYPTQNMIPADNSFITALLKHSNGFVYGATSGREQSYLFFYNRYINKVRPLGKIGEARGVHHTLLEGSDGSIYIGTGLNVLVPVKLTKTFPVEYEGVEKQLWKDIKQPYASYAGGHLYRYDPKAGDGRRYTNADACPLEDLGIPVAGNTIYAMAWSADRKILYGISYPDAHFFAFEIAIRRVRDFGEFLSKHVYGGPERQWRSVPRALWCDGATGAVYTSGDNGWIVRFDPGTGKFDLTGMRLPGEYWESLKSIDYPVVECFTRDAKENLFAGTSDGYLLRVDLEGQKLQVLGKPRVQRRMRALDTGRDGKLYMICGETDMMCKLYSFDTQGTGGFCDLGVLAVDRSPYYAKRAYRFDAMAVGGDGTVFLGESDRRGKLFLYTPGAEPFPGDMNPTNPVVDRMKPGTPALIPEAL
jgi:hypothetical protein